MKIAVFGIAILSLGCQAPEPVGRVSKGDYKIKPPEGINLPVLAWCPNKIVTLKVTNEYMRLCGLGYVDYAVKYLTRAGQPLSIAVIDEIPCKSIYDECEEYNTIFLGVNPDKVPEQYVGYSRSEIGKQSKKFFISEIHVITCRYNVLLHELGHSIGMRHSDIPNHVMYPNIGYSMGIGEAEFTDEELEAMENNKSLLLLNNYCG